MSHHPEINWKEFIPPTLTAEIEEECGLTLKTPIDEILDSFFEYINKSAIYPINSYSIRSLLVFLVSNNYKEFHTLQKSKSNIPNRLKSWVREMLSLYNCQNYTLSFYKWRLKKRFKQDFYSILAQFYKQNFLGNHSAKLVEIRNKTIYLTKSLENFIMLTCSDPKRHIHSVKVVDEAALNKYIHDNFETEYLRELWSILSTLKINPQEYGTCEQCIDFMCLISKAKVYIRFMFTAQEKALLNKEYLNYQKAKVTQEFFQTFVS